MIQVLEKGGKGAPERAVAVCGHAGAQRKLRLCEKNHRLNGQNVQMKSGRMVQPVQNVCKRERRLLVTCECEGDGELRSHGFDLEAGSEAICEELGGGGARGSALPTGDHGGDEQLLCLHPVDWSSNLNIIN
jgi:hypothetical protein